MLGSAVATLTFAHVRAAPDLAGVLRAGGIYLAAQLEEAGLVPFCGIGDDLVEETVEALRLQIVRGGSERKVKAWRISKKDKLLGLW